MSSEGRNSNNGLVVILVAGIVGVVLLGICGLGLGFFVMARTVQTNAASFPIPQDQAFVQGAMKEANDEANAPILSPGGSITHDGITLTLEKVQRGDVTVREDRATKVLPGHYVLTFKWENKSDGVIVERTFVNLQKGKDNFGNTFSELIESIADEKYKDSDELKPGDSGYYFLLAKPTVENAESFEGVLRWRTRANEDSKLGRLKFNASDVTKFE